MWWHFTQGTTQCRTQLTSLLRIQGVKCLSLGIPANTAAEQSSLTIFMVASKLSIRGFLDARFRAKTEHRWPQQVSPLAKGHSPEEKEKQKDDEEEEEEEEESGILATHKRIMHATLGGARFTILQFSWWMCKSVYKTITRFPGKAGKIR